MHTLLSTGSPLPPESFLWIYQTVKNNVLVGSITGGTDICSLFAGHCATLPVYKGEIQCRCLGMAVEGWDDDGKVVVNGSHGDLVCISKAKTLCVCASYLHIPPFPSRRTIPLHASLLLGRSQE